MSRHPDRNCKNGDDCKTWYTCGGMYKCGQGAIECIQEHYRHECAHDFQSGGWKVLHNGGTSSCECGMTADSHDMRHGP